MDADRTPQNEVTRQSLERMTGPVVVEFGSEWCGICQAFAPQLRELLQTFPAVQHLKIEDGRGKPLGRSFAVTLWPTLIFLRDGQVQQKLVRPNRHEAQRALMSLVETQP